MIYTADPLIKFGLRPDYSDAFNAMNSAIAGIATTSSSFWEANNSGIRYQGHIAVGVGAAVDTLPPLTALTGTSSANITNYGAFTDGSLAQNAVILNTMSVDATANNASNWIAQNGLIEIKSGNTRNYTGLVAGDGGAAYHYGTGTLSEFDGLFGLTENNSSGNVTLAQDIRALGLNYGSGTITTHYGLSSLLVQISGTNVVTTHHGLHISNPLIFGGSVTNNYGAYIEPQSGGGTTNYGLIIGAATTNTLWINNLSTGTTEAGGIVFGLNRDVNLYPSATDTLKTDDTFSAAAYMVGATAGASGSWTTVDGKTVTSTNGIITSIV